MNTEYEPILTYKQAEFDEEVDQVLSTEGPVPKSVKVTPVRCPFEDLIQVDEMKVDKCKNASRCKLGDSLDLCIVPHLHNFFSPGAHIEHSEVTITKGFSLQAALKRVAAKTDLIKRDLKAGRVFIKPKRLPRRMSTETAQVIPNATTRAEAYSVYECKTTPAQHDKYIPDMTKDERWEVADRRESKRIGHIMLCRQFKIDAMLG